jgi:GNAT superfamily N-acetyltransferase
MICGLMAGDFHLIEVKTKKDIREFHDLPSGIYRGDSNWIKPLTKEIETVFNPSLNPQFRKGEAIRWILKDGSGKTVGRVAAFYSRKIANKDQISVGGMGFFECINDSEAAAVLFNACRDWLEDNGMTAMEGPENFGERDRWWGLLVDGFLPPNFCMPYNPAYYRELFENYGFKNYFEQYTYHTPVTGRNLDEVIRTKAERIFANPDYTFRYMRSWEARDTARNFMIVYNKGWARFPGVKTISERHARLIMKSFRSIHDEKLVWFGFYKNEPVCFFIMLPEVNQIIRHLNGKLNNIGRLKFLWYRYIRKEITRAFGMIFGIVPEHQRKGVEGALIISFARLALKSDFPYKDLEFNWIGDFNPSMMHLLDQIGARITKTHITYRYLFDRNAPFNRAPVVNV